MTTILDHKFASIPKERADFGSMPNGSVIDLAFYPKIDHAILANKIMHYSNYEDMILLIKFLVGKTLMLRGGKEHNNLAWSNYCVSMVTSGKYIGRKKLDTVNVEDKCMYVSVKNPSRHDNTSCWDT